MASNQRNDAPLRVIFMGTPAFAVPAIDALLDIGCEVAGVYTQPDRRSGRGRRVTASPVKDAALERGLPVFQPASLRRDEAARRQLASLQPDLIVVAAYGLFLPPDTLRVPPLGALNIHPSLLPRHRGPSPVATAILEGDSVTGVTVMQLDEGMDSGPVIAQRQYPIDPEETADQLTARLFEEGADLLADTIPLWRSGKVDAVPQKEGDATVTKLLRREDGLIDWTQTAEYIARQVRAYQPWPGSFTRWGQRQLKVLEAAAAEAPDEFAAGTALEVSQGIGVATGDGVLMLRRVQVEGRQAADIGDFVRGYSDFVGSLLGAS